MRTQLHKIGQSGVFLGIILGPTLKTGLLLMKNVAAVHAVAASAINAIQNNIFGSSMTTLLISNKEMDRIMKMVKSVKELKMKLKKKTWVLSKGMKAKILGQRVMKTGEVAIRASQDFFMVSYPFTNLDIHKYEIPNEPKSNSLYSEKCLPKKAVLKKKCSKKSLKIDWRKIIKTNVYRMQANDSLCGYFRINFFEFMLKGKRLLVYTNLFTPNKYEKYDKIIIIYF